MDKQAEIARIKAEYEARNREIDRQHRQEMAKIIGGGLLQGASFHPIFNIPYVGTGLGGAMFEAGNAIMQGKSGKDILSDAGKGFVVGETVGAIPYAGKGLSKTKVGQVVAKGADDLVKRLADTPIAQNTFANKLANVIVDDTGNPKKFYHASNAKFDNFDKSKIKENKIGLAFNFTDDLNNAYQYGDNLYEVNLQMKNPLTIDKWDETFPYDNYNDFGRRLLNEPDYVYNKLDYEKHPYTFGEMFNTYKMEPEFIKTLQNMGYDGLSFPEQKHYGVFEPEQIKIIKKNW